MGKKRFDATLKQLVELYPGDWLAFFAALLGVSNVGRVEVIDSDVSTVSAAVDKVIRVRGRRLWIFHLELLASHRHRLAEQLLLYNVLIGDRHRLPVRTAVLLLRPEADRASLNGNLELKIPEGDCYLSFRYTVVRLWQQPVDALLGAGRGLLPLAPLADVPQARVPEVLRRMGERLRREATPEETADAWATSFILLGLRYPAAIVEQLLQGVREMEESTTYQAILAKGEAKGELREARKILQSIGGRKLGPPDEATRGAIEAITDLGQLEQLIERATQATNWADLFASPKPRRGGNGRRRKNT
jgi:predicted transposase YdaD